MKIKKLKKWKKYSEKNLMSAKSDNFFFFLIQKEKKTQNYHGP